jgi:hypothetical protein
MRLTARKDDRQLLQEIQSTTALGSLIAIPARSTSQPQTAWSVVAKADCLRLVEILNTYPLRGRKSFDYAIWGTAVGWWVGDDPTRTIVGRDWAPMAYLKTRLQEVKKYAPPSLYSLREDTSPPHDDWDAFFSGFVTAEGHLAIGQNGEGRY